MLKYYLLNYLLNMQYFQAILIINIKIRIIQIFLYPSTQCLGIHYFHKKFDVFLESSQFEMRDVQNASLFSVEILHGAGQCPISLKKHLYPSVA